MSCDQILSAARAALSGIPKEGLGEERTSRWRGQRIVRVGEAWHVGVLLLTDERVFATGEILRAADPGRRGYAAESARERAARRQMALRGGFREGEVVHVGWSDASSVLSVRDGVPMVRWSGASAGRSAGSGGGSGMWRPLEVYLQEQIDLKTGR